MMDEQKEWDLFRHIMSYNKDVAFEDIVGDENLIRDRADDNEALENLIFEYGLFHFVEEAYKVHHPEITENIISPIVIKEMKKVVKYLRNEWSILANDCGEDDEFNTIPAKKAYKRAKRIYKHMKGTSCD